MSPRLPKAVAESLGSGLVSNQMNVSEVPDRYKQTSPDRQTDRQTDAVRDTKSMAL